MSHATRVSPLILACAALALAACGSDDGAKPATQVAAKVNKEEISVHQINNAMTRLQGLPEAQAKQASAQVLERLIDQELLVQKAVENKLDRDPKVMQAIEASRRQILSQAYVEKTMASATKPAPEEITKFYKEHPELFAERRIYRLQELAVQARGEQADKIRAGAERAKSLNEIAAALKADGLRFNANATVKAAEQLPLEVLPKLAQAKDGQILVLPAQGALLIVQVAASQSMPLNEKEATPYIEQFLLNQQRMKVAQAEVKQLRGGAKVEYVGEFAKLAQAPAQTTPGTPATASDAPGSAPPAGAMDKGLSGLR